MRRAGKYDDGLITDPDTWKQPNRSRWNQRQIAEGLLLVESAMRAGSGPYALQAAIAAVHCRAARAEDTDWREILHLYDQLERVQPSPIVSLNRAVAVAMARRSSGRTRADRGPGGDKRTRRLPLIACRPREVQAANRLAAAEGS